MPSPRHGHGFRGLQMRSWVREILLNLVVEVYHVPKEFFSANQALIREVGENHNAGFVLANHDPTS